MDLLFEFLETLLLLLRDVMPIMVILFGFQLFILRRRIKNPRQVLI